MRQRPPWWNEDTPFPPQASWYPMRRRLFWRFGFLFFLLVFLGCGAFTFLFWSFTLSFTQNTFPGSGVVFLRPLGFIAFIFALVILAATFRAFRRAIDPLAEVIDAAQRVADGDYATRVRVRGPRDVRSLGNAFNEMVTRLQANDEQRRRLLADVSHELRTPLTVIQGNLEGMMDGVYPMDAAHLEPVLDETRQLARLIQDLRTLALAESGALHLQRESTDLAILLNEAIASFRPQAEKEGITLAVELAPDVPNVNVDPARLRQVMENLIANALRYTARGGEIRVTCRADNGKNVSVEVKDTGRGIASQELPHIFERFYKARDSSGTGLGLAIAQDLVRAHGGTIAAESTIGKGTNISFTLPL